MVFLLSGLRVLRLSMQEVRAVNMQVCCTKSPGAAMFHHVLKILIFKSPRITCITVHKLDISKGEKKTSGFHILPKIHICVLVYIFLECLTTQKLLGTSNTDFHIKRPAASVNSFSFQISRVCKLSIKYRINHKGFFSPMLILM